MRTLTPLGTFIHTPRCLAAIEAATKICNFSHELQPTVGQKRYKTRTQEVTRPATPPRLRRLAPPFHRTNLLVCRNGTRCGLGRFAPRACPPATAMTDQPGWPASVPGRATNSTGELEPSHNRRLVILGLGGGLLHPRHLGLSALLCRRGLLRCLFAGGLDDVVRGVDGASLYHCGTPRHMTLATGHPLPSLCEHLQRHSR